MSFRTDTWLNMTRGVGQTLPTAVNTCYGGSSTAAEITNAFLTLGMGVATMALSAKQAGSIQNTNAEISKSAKGTIASYSADIAAATGKFNTKYGKFGASISTDGVPTKTYAQIKADLTSKGKMLQEAVDADKKDNVQKYGVQQAVVTSLEVAESNFNNLASTLEGIATSCQGKINITNGTASAVDPDGKEFEKYLTQEQKDSGLDGTSTQAYQDEKAMREAKASEYNRLQAQQKDICSQNGIDYNNGKPDFTTKISDAKAELTKLGEAKVNGSMSVATQVSSLESINTQLIELGTEAEFNAAVQEVKDIATAYNNALDIQKQETRSSEFDTAAKNDKAALKKAKRGGHKGLRGWFYDISHKDKKDANVMAAKNQYNISKGKANDQRIALQKTYEQYYPDS